MKKGLFVMALFFFALATQVVGQWYGNGYGGCNPPPVFQPRPCRPQPQMGYLPVNLNLNIGGGSQPARPYYNRGYYPQQEVVYLQVQPPPQVVYVQAPPQQAPQQQLGYVQQNQTLDYYPQPTASAGYGDGKVALTPGLVQHYRLDSNRVFPQLQFYLEQEVILTPVAGLTQTSNRGALIEVSRPIRLGEHELGVFYTADSAGNFIDIIFDKTGLVLRFVKEENHFFLLTQGVIKFKGVDFQFPDRKVQLLIRVEGREEVYDAQGVRYRP